MKVGQKLAIVTHADDGRVGTLKYDNPGNSANRAKTCRATHLINKWQL
jgi:hypothetical protein